MFRIIPGLIALSVLACQSKPEEKDPVHWPPEPNLRDSLTIEQLVASINDDAPNTHPDYTPSVCDLMERGLDVIPHVLPLMLSEDEETRSRAETVLLGIVARDLGFKLGEGWTVPDGEQHWQELLIELGNLSAESSKVDREIAVKKWTKWYNSKKKT